jgi:hypothetical protein
MRNFEISGLNHLIKDLWVGESWQSGSSGKMFNKGEDR